MTVDLQLLRNGSMNAEQVALLGEAWRGLDGLDTSMKTDDNAVDDDVSVVVGEACDRVVRTSAQGSSKIVALVSWTS